MTFSSTIHPSICALFATALLAGCPGDEGASTSEASETGTSEGDGDGDPAGDGDGDPSGDGDADPTGDGDGDGDPSGDGDGDQGECYDISDDVSPPIGPDCMLPTPCADAEFATNDFCEVSADYDPAVGQCILDALAAGDPATVRVRDCPGGQFSESWHVQILGDGTGIWRRSEFQDIGGNGRVTWRALPEASYYEGCSAATAADLVACIGALVDGECQLGEPVCPE